MLKIVLDGMGSDTAPVPEIEGAVLAVKENSEIEITVVGDEEELRKVLPVPPRRIVYLHAPQRIFMEEKPSEALRSKKESSIALGLDLLKKGTHHAFVSAGNTGAIMAFSLKILGRIKGIKRPAIGAIFPGHSGYSLLLDVGANVDVKPINLVQFAYMGKIYMEKIVGIENPRVALLSVGEEKTKGNEVVKETRKILEQQKDLNFIGYVEGNDILYSKADVIVTDGFTGNILLKFGESVVEFLKDILSHDIRKNPIAYLGAILMKKSLYNLKKRLDYEEYGGAPLLGINGIVVISHGRSTPKAIKNALLVAFNMAKQNVLKLFEREALAHSFHLP